MKENPLHLPGDAAAVIVPFLVKAITFTHSSSDGKWGLTDYRSGVRVNAGFTEVITTRAREIRLIVDRAKLPVPASLRPASIEYSSRKNRKDYYPSIPGSACVTVPYHPLRRLRVILRDLTPALFEAISKSGRRGLGRGVSAGHSRHLVRDLAKFAGRPIPQPRNVVERMTRAARKQRDASAMEGALRRVVSNKYERNTAARNRCVAHHGAICAVCEFVFVAAFGTIGQGFIHIHHLVPVASRSRRYRVDPVRDLIPVCPNCHAMLHKQDPPYGVDELKLLRRQP